MAPAAQARWAAKCCARCGKRAQPHRPRGAAGERHERETMSRVGKRPIAIPKGVEVQYEERVVRLKGPKGQNQFSLPQEVEVELTGGEIRVKADYLHDTRARALMGPAQSC